MHRWAEPEIFLSLLVGLLVFSGLSLAAGSTTVGAPQRPADLNPCLRHPKESLNPYRIGPGDKLSIKSLNFPEINTDATVGPDGGIAFPMLGVVDVDGLTVDELTLKLKDSLDNSYLSAPLITVAMAGYHSRKVFLLGDVQKAGTYYLETTTRILDLLAHSGVSNSKEELFADKQVKILRRCRTGARTGESATNGVKGSLRLSNCRGCPEALEKSDSPSPPPVSEADDPEIEVKSLSVSLREIFFSGDASLNIELQDEDVVFVSGNETYSYYLIGEVRDPGFYTLKENLTVFEAVIRAKGFTSSASRSVRITRTVNGKQKKLKAKMTDIIQPGDILEAKASLF